MLFAVNCDALTPSGRPRYRWRLPPLTIVRIPSVKRRQCVSGGVDSIRPGANSTTLRRMRL
jgi:hypothetical protein